MIEHTHCTRYPCVGYNKAGGMRTILCSLDCHLQAQWNWMHADVTTSTVVVNPTSSARCDTVEQTVQ